METIGERVVRLRQEKGWNQASLVKASKLPQSTVASIESDARTKESGSLIEVAHALGVDAYWLKTGIGEPHGKRLSDDEEKIISAYRLFGSEMRTHWLKTAESKLAEVSAERQKNKAA